MNIYEDFEPMDLGELLNKTFKIYFNRLGSFFGCLLLSYLPVVVVGGGCLALLFLVLGGAAILGDQPDFAEMGVSFFIGLFFIAIIMLVTSFISFGLATGSIAHVVSAAYMGRKLDVISALKKTLGRLAPLLTNAMVLGLILIGVMFGSAIVIAFVGFLAGLVHEALAFLVMIPAMAAYVAAIAFVIVAYKLLYVTSVLENGDSAQCRTRAFELLKGHRWTAFFLGLILWGIGYALSMGMSAVSFGLMLFVNEVLGLTLTYLGSIFISLLVAPLGYIGATLLYYDMRIRKEGFDLEMLSEDTGWGHSNSAWE